MDMQNEKWKQHEKKNGYRIDKDVGNSKILPFYTSRHWKSWQDAWDYNKKCFTQKPRQKQNPSINLEQKPIVNRQLPNIELNYKEQIQYFKICALLKDVGKTINNKRNCSAICFIRSPDGVSSRRQPCKPLFAIRTTWSWILI